MATRLYYVASTVPVQSPAFDAGWSSTADAVRRTLDTAQGAATETLSGSVGNTSTALVVQFVSPPLAAQTISGSFTLVSRGRELNTTDNVNQRWRSVRVFSADGSTVRGTLNSYGVTGSTTEFAAFLAGQPHAVNGSLSPVVCQDGDVLVVEVGYGLSATGTTPQWEMELGGTGTDHSTSINDASGSVPWVEFSADLVFLPPGATVSGLAEAAFGFGAAVSGSRLVGGSAASLLTLDVAAAGTPVVVGGAVVAVSFGAAGSGVRLVPGAVAGGLSWAAAAAGVRAVPGVAGCPLGWSASTVGARWVLGSAAAFVGFSAAGVGAVVPGPAMVAGVAVAALGFGAAAPGLRVVPGAAGVVFGFDAVVVGVVVVAGAASADLSFAAVGVGGSHTPGAVVPRPHSGVVARPLSVVSRPSTGVVVRP